MRLNDYVCLASEYHVGMGPLENTILTMFQYKEN